MVHLTDLETFYCDFNMGFILELIDFLIQNCDAESKTHKRDPLTDKKAQFSLRQDLLCILQVFFRIAPNLKETIRN